ncbi:hypothetical protein C0991_004044, partial [Blastosporella zonata]
VPDAGFTRGGIKHECLQGTREVVISEIMNWAGEENNQRICWLSGPAGFGKSAIMQTVAERLNGEGSLAASFFFLRGAGARSEFTRFIVTLAYHISYSIPDSQPFIHDALRMDPTLLSQSMKTQLQKLVIDPLGHILPRAKQMIIVVDALDECDDHKSIADFIGLLVQPYNDLPFQFLLASRAENHIAEAFALDAAQSITCFLKLESFNSRQDITVFLTSRFDTICKQRPRLFQDMQEKWPSSDDLMALAKKSDGLFIFAATVVSFITDGKGSPQEKLKQVLTSHVGLDPLYTQVLSNANRDEAFSKVLTAIIYLREEISITSLAKVLDMTPEAVVNRLTEIQSIIRIPADNQGSVQLNHTSFRDFLLAKTQSKNYYLLLGDASMASWSLALMVNSLKQDHWPKDKAEEYACQQWCFHLEGAIRGYQSGEVATGILEIVQRFTRCEALEVWINTVIRDVKTNTTMECLQEIKKLCQV